VVLFPKLLVMESPTGFQMIRNDLSRHGHRIFTFHRLLRPFPLSLGECTIARCSFQNEIRSTNLVRWVTPGVGSQNRKETDQANDLIRLPRRSKRRYPWLRNHIGDNLVPEPVASGFTKTKKMPELPPL
jgi:hypothetical protein